MTEVSLPRRAGRPSAAEAIRIQVRIISTARRLFFEQGIAATRMETVAKAAGITKQTLYARFQCKEDLYRAVIDEVIGIWRERQGALIGDFKTLEEALYHHSINTLRTATREGSVLLGNFLNAEAGRNPDLIKTMIEPIRTRGIHDIETILGNFSIQGRAPLFENRVAAEYFFMALVGKINDLYAFREEINENNLAAWSRSAVRFFLLGYQPK